MTKAQLFTCSVVTWADAACMAGDIGELAAACIALGSHKHGYSDSHQKGVNFTCDVVVYGKRSCYGPTQTSDLVN